jgi:hypothetical protein
VEQRATPAVFFRAPVRPEAAREDAVHRLTLLGGDAAQDERASRYDRARDLGRAGQQHRSREVGHDHVGLEAGLLPEVGLAELDVRRGAVQCRIAARVLQRVGIDVDRDDGRRPEADGRQREDA